MAAAKGQARKAFIIGSRIKIALSYSKAGVGKISHPRGSNMKQWAIVTGASSGIGKEIATRLAQKGYSLVLVARSKEALDTHAAFLTATYRINVEILVLDLALRESASRLDAFVEEKQLQVEILVNNAGMGVFGKFVETELSSAMHMMELNMTSLIQLTHLFAARMVRQGGGKILQVASLGSFMPTPQYAIYGATKAFVLSASLAIRQELKGTGVSVTVLCPGFTLTNFFDNASQLKVTWIMKLLMMTSDKVAQIAVSALLKGKSIVVPGWIYRFLVFIILPFLPRSLVTELAGRAIR
jgi:short-subunit dehydrogenase